MTDSHFQKDLILFELPPKKSRRIWPFFLPFLGCPKRCIYCAQEAQTGIAAGGSRESIRQQLAEIAEQLARSQEAGQREPELAFYGGTFTAVPEAIWRDCLEAGQALLAKGLISGLRCSTRPDALEPARLAQLAAAGFSLVELGIQSFDGAALAKSGRGYSTQIAREAPQRLAAQGLPCGIQLLPGMPGVTPEVFVADVVTALEYRPACLRFYPCLVLAGSPLARLWQKGEYQPWNLAQTLGSLARGWLMAARAAVPVIRMGLASQSGLEKAILAGPQHEALGSRIIANALLLAVREKLAALPSGTRIRLYVPRALQGCFRGWRGELSPQWQALGISPASITWCQEAVFRLSLETPACVPHGNF